MSISFTSLIQIMNLVTIINVFLDYFNDLVFPYTELNVSVPSNFILFGIYSQTFINIYQYSLTFRRK